MTRLSHTASFHATNTAELTQTTLSKQHVETCSYPPDSVHSIHSAQSVIKLSRCTVYKQKEIDGDCNHTMPGLLTEMKV